MRPSSSLLRPSARCAVFLPFALWATACSDSDSVEPRDPATANGGDDDGSANGNGGSNNSNGSANGGANTSGSANNGGSTGATLGPAPVSFGAASDYVILAQSAITNVPTSVITGDLGLSPAAASFVTGFALTRAGV